MNGGPTTIWVKWCTPARCGSWIRHTRSWHRGTVSTLCRGPVRSTAPSQVDDGGPRVCSWVHSSPTTTTTALASGTSNWTTHWRISLTHGLAARLSLLPTFVCNTMGVMHRVARVCLRQLRLVRLKSSSISFGNRNCFFSLQFSRSICSRLSRPRHSCSVTNRATAFDVSILTNTHSYVTWID